MPHDLPFRQAVCDQAPRWLRAGCFESLVHNLRAVLRLAAGRPKESLAVVLGSRALRSTPQVGTRATWDRQKPITLVVGHSPRSKRTQVRTMRAAFTSSNSSRSGPRRGIPKPEASTGKTYGQLGCTRWKEISSARPAPMREIIPRRRRRHQQLPPRAFFEARTVQQHRTSLRAFDQTRASTTAYRTDLIQSPSTGKVNIKSLCS